MEKSEYLAWFQRIGCLWKLLTLLAKKITYSRFWCCAITVLEQHSCCMTKPIFGTHSKWNPAQADIYFLFIPYLNCWGQQKSQQITKCWQYWRNRIKYIDLFSCGTSRFATFNFKPATGFPAQRKSIAKQGQRLEILSPTQQYYSHSSGWCHRAGQVWTRGWRYSNR